MIDKEAREKIAIELVKSLTQAMGFGKYKAGHWNLMTEAERQIYLRMADQILEVIPDGLPEGEPPLLEPDKLTVDGALKIYDEEGIVGVVEAVKKIKDAELRRAIETISICHEGELQTKDEECQERVGKIFGEIEQKYGDRIGRIVGISVNGWQALKKQEG